MVLTYRILINWAKCFSSYWTVANSEKLIKHLICICKRICLNRKDICQSCLATVIVVVVVVEQFPHWKLKQLTAHKKGPEGGNIINFLNSLNWGYPLGSRGNKRGKITRRKTKRKCSTAKKWEGGTKWCPDNIPLWQNRF